MRNSLTVSAVILMSLGTAALGMWAATVGPQPLERSTPPTSSRVERIEPYRARFGRKRPLVAIIGENSATELTDFVIPFGILAQADVADLVTLGTRPGDLTMRPALHIRPDSTAAAFDARHPEGADYVIVPAVVKRDDPALLAWLVAQGAKGSTIVSICDGALVVANTGLMRGHRATAHWATLDLRRKAYPDVTWVENTRYVADGHIVSSAGISAAIPTTLALVEAIGGRAKATVVAHDIGVADWGTAHDSDIFKPRFGRNLTAFVTTNYFNHWLHRQETIGVPVAQGVDEIGLALTADAYSRTGRSKAYSMAASAQPVVSRHRLVILPDRLEGERQAVDRVVAPPDLKPGAQLSEVLVSVGRAYGRLTAFGVALDFEYPGFK